MPESHPIILNVTYQQDLSVPIVYYSKLRGLEVKLFLHKVESNEYTQAYTAGLYSNRQSLTYLLNPQVSTVLNQQEYMKVLTKDDLVETGIYTGVLLAQMDGEDYETQTIIVNVSAHPLMLDTTFNFGNSSIQKNVYQMLEEVYSYILSIIVNLEYDEDGNAIIKYGHNSSNQRIIMFRGLSGGFMPVGSRYTVLRDNTDRNLPPSPVLKYENRFLIPTDSIGNELSNQNINITDDSKPAHYAIIQDLPIGKYIVFASYPMNNSISTTEWQYINF